MAEGNQISLGVFQDALKTTLNDYMKSLKPDPQLALPAADKVPGSKTVGMGQNFIESIDNFRIPVLNISLPWVSATVGLSTGMVVSKVIDAVLPPEEQKLFNPLLQLAAAGVEAKFLPGNLGKFAAGAHLLNLALRYTPLSEWLLKIENMLSSPLTKESAGSRTPRRITARPRAGTPDTTSRNGNYSYPAPGFASPAYN